MDSTTLDDGAVTRMDTFLEGIGSTLKDKRQRASFALYAAGLMSDGERKSMEPIAARTTGDPHTVLAMHHKLVHFVSSPAWADAPIRMFSARYAVNAMQAHAPIRTWVVDDTGFLKQGKHSPGVQRQYTGTAGKTTNCQIGVSLVLGNDYAHVPVDFRLYLPESWTSDPARCRRAHIPLDCDYAPKWCLALEMIETALQAGLPKGIVLADCGYGNTTVFRDTLTTLGLQYAVEIQSTSKLQSVNHAGEFGDRLSAMELGKMLERKVRRVTWREGTNTTLHSRFARIRVVVTRDDGQPRDPEWLLVEWPEGETRPTKFVLTSLPSSISCVQLVRIFKSRWRIERSYEDLKGELGLDHYEGRSWVGWHHHVTVALACYAFLVAEQMRSFPPSAARATHHDPHEHTARTSLPRLAHHGQNVVSPRRGSPLASVMSMLPSVVHQRSPRKLTSRWFVG
jgi:SRSO17 transposase